MEIIDKAVEVFMQRAREEGPLPCCESYGAMARQALEALDTFVTGFAYTGAWHWRESGALLFESAEMTVELGRGLGFSAEDLLYLRWGALLQDWGMLWVPDTVYFKKEPLSPKD